MTQVRLYGRCGARRAELGERGGWDNAGVGGVILFKRNIESPEQVAQLCRNLKHEAGDRPLLIMVDQEGGRVARLGPPRFTDVPSARRLSTTDDCEAAAAAAGTVRDALRTAC